MTRRRRLWSVVGLLLILVLAYWGITLYLEHRIETFLADQFPGQTRLESVTIDFLPPGVSLHGLQLRLPPPAPSDTHFSVDRISLDVGLGSLWAKSTEINAVLLTRPVVEMSSLSPRDLPTGATSRQSRSSSHPFAGMDLAINSIRVVQGQIRYTPKSGPQRELRPIDARVGRLDLRQPDRSVSFRVGLSAQNRQPVQLRGSLRNLWDDPTLTSSLSLDRTPLSQLNPLLSSSRFKGGQLTGEVKIRYESGEMRVEPAEQLRMSGGTLKLRGVSVRTGTRQRSPEPKTFPSSDPPGPGPVWSVKPLDLNLSELEINLPGNRGLTINRGVLRYGPKNRTDETAPFVGNLLLAEPKGTLKFVSRASVLAEPRGLRKLLALMEVPRVESLNSLTAPGLPFQFKRGFLQSSLSGRALAAELDLSLDMQFRELALDYSSEEGTIVDLPLSLVVDYLKRKDGQLQLSVHVTGTPGSPRFNTASIRNKIVMNLGIEAAVLSSVGLPVYLGSKIIEGTTGFSLLGETRSLIGSVFSNPDKKVDLAEEMDGVDSIPRIENLPERNDAGN